jgi:hypothetical protein
MLCGRISHFRLLVHWMWHTKCLLYLHHRDISTVSRFILAWNWIFWPEFGSSDYQDWFKKTHTDREFVCVCVVKADSDTYDLTSPIPRTPSGPVLLHIPVKAVPWTVKRNLHTRNLLKHDSLPLHINCKLPPEVQDHIQFLVALEKLRTATISFVTFVRLSVCPSVCRPNGTNRVLLGRSSWNSIRE